MLSVASRYLGRVDASDSKKEYLCSIVGSCLRKHQSLCSRTFVLFTLRTLLKAIIGCLQLNTQWLLGRHPEGGLLVIDAVGLRSIYFFVMPRVNLIVILMTDCWVMALEKSWCLVECPARWEPQEEGVMNIAARSSLS
jgi:hypothetical protein